MEPIEQTELSGYLDGELSIDRAREIEQAIASDPELKSQLDVLTKADASWRVAARSAYFSPEVRVSSVPIAIGLIPGSLLALVLITYLLAKTLNIPVWGLLLHAITFLMVLIWVVRMARNEHAWGSGATRA